MVCSGGHPEAGADPWGGGGGVACLDSILSHLEPTGLQDIGVALGFGSPSYTALLNFCCFFFNLP